MAIYNVEERKVKEAIQQLYRDFALQYSEIQKSELSESEKQIRINRLTENTKEVEQFLRNTRSLSKISSEDREDLGIKEVVDPEVDENIVNALVLIYARRAKIPNERNVTNESIRNKGSILDALTEKGETLKKTDTTAFEEELRKYFTEHYSDLFATEYNNFLSAISEDDGDLCKIARKYDIKPTKFIDFGGKITVQDGLVAEEVSYRGSRGSRGSIGVPIEVKINTFYATPDGINKRIFDLYSKALYIRQGTGGRDFKTRRLKDAYISWAKEKGIEITNPDVLDTIDMAKVKELARYINRVVNDKGNVKKGDYTQLFQDDIIKNYSKIMNLDIYHFSDLDSVKRIVGESAPIDELCLYLDEDHITMDENIVYGTPKFVKAEYKKIMQEVGRLHQSNAIIEGYFDLENITDKKQEYRRYIQESGKTGVDISIPKVEIDHERTGMIAEAIMKQYGKNYEDPENMKKRILAKLEDNWAEIVTEAQVMNISKLFGEELKEMGHKSPDERLYVKDDFVFLGTFPSIVIYATPEALRKNLEALDSIIESNDVDFYAKDIRSGLVRYAKEHKFDMQIPSVESVEARRKANRKKESFGKRTRGPGSKTDGFVRKAYREPGMRMMKSVTEFLSEDLATGETLGSNDSKIDPPIYEMPEDGLASAVAALTANFVTSNEAGSELLLALDDMNIRGSQIWVAYKYLYNEDGQKFAEAVKNRDETMVQFINEELASVDGEKAVTGGASSERNKTPNKYRFTEKEVNQLKQQRETRIRMQNQIANIKAKRKEIGQKSISELDRELTDLQTKKQEAEVLCEQYESQLPNKSLEKL